MAALASTRHRPVHPRASPLTRPGDIFEIVESKPVNQISFYFQHRGNAERFLLVPARCPEQPRFWCFWVYRCDRGDTVDIRKSPWVSPERLRRVELRARAQVIHDEIDGWLKGAGQATLRSWMHDGALGAG